MAFIENHALDIAFRADLCHASTSAADLSFTSGTMTKSLLSILVSANVLIRMPFFAENIHLMFGSAPKDFVHGLLPMLPGEDMCGNCELLVDPSACYRIPEGFILDMSGCFTFGASIRLKRKFP